MAKVTLSMGVLENYASGVRAVSEQSSDVLADSLAAIDLTDRGLVEDLVMGACRAASQAGTDYATAFYRGLSLLQTGEDVDFEAMSTFDQRATLIAIRGIYKQATDEDGELDEGLLARELVRRVSFEANRATKVGVWERGQQDSRDVRYARVPAGAETCAWCLMTAGLGYWFMTEEAASHTHAHCDCVIVPSIGRGDVVIDGYDSTKYRDMWREANEALRYGDVPTELAQRVDFLAATRPGYRTDTNGALAVMRWKYGLK